EQRLQPQCRVGRDAAFAVDELRHADERDAEPLSELGLGEVERLQELLQQHLSWMRRRTVRGNANHWCLRDKGFDRMVMRRSVVIDDFNVRGTIVPAKADAILIVDANAVLPLPVAAEC